MKTRNTFSSALMLGALVVGLVTVAAVWNALPVSAIKEVEGRPQFGVISLAVGQTARLNVVAGGIVPLEVEGSPARATKVTLAFDLYAPATATEPTGAGAVPACVNKLVFLRRESCEVTLRPGEVASLEFTAPQGTRISAVMFGEVEGKKKGGDDQSLRATLEVMEAGRTIFVHPGSAVGFNPQPDPPGQPVR